MKNRRVLKEWEKFRREIVRNDPPPNVLLSMRIAFYGGVAILSRILKDTTGDQEADMEMLRDIDAEVSQFASEVKALRDDGPTA